MIHDESVWEIWDMMELRKASWWWRHEGRFRLDDSPVGTKLRLEYLEIRASTLQTGMTTTTALFEWLNHVGCRKYLQYPIETIINMISRYSRWQYNEVCSADVACKKKCSILRYNPHDWTSFSVEYLSRDVRPHRLACKAPPSKSRGV